MHERFGMNLDAQYQRQKQSQFNVECGIMWLQIHGTRFVYFDRSFGNKTFGKLQILGLEFSGSLHSTGKLLLVGFCEVYSLISSQLYPTYKSCQHDSSKRCFACFQFWFLILIRREKTEGKSQEVKSLTGISIYTR